MLLAGSKPAPGELQTKAGTEAPGPGLVSATLISGLLALLSAFPATTAKAQSSAPKNERELIAVLRSDAPEGEKAVTCKQLALYGTSEAVPELAKLLSNEKLNSWARIALEAIPGSEVDEALRQASDSLQGRQRKMAAELFKHSREHRRRWHLESLLPVQRSRRRPYLSASVCCECRRHRRCHRS